MPQQHRTPGRVLLRALTVLAGAAVGAQLLVLMARGPAGQLLGAVRDDGLASLLRMPAADVVTGLSAWGLIACATWLFLLTSLLVGEVVRPTARRVRPCPRTLRRIVLAACGVALATGGIAPAAASPTGQQPATWGPRAARTTLDGLPLPDRAHGGPPAATEHTDTRVRVRQGDSLWVIARAALARSSRHEPVAAPPADREVWRATRALYRANRDAIGKNPDLILPGTTLRIPAPLHEREEAR
jgi:hypothetical protein